MQGAVTADARHELALEKKRKLDQSFLKKGLMIALYSGITYGLYSAFIMAAQTQGVWADWMGTLEASSFLVVFILPTIATALNDLFSAVWALLLTAKQGKLGDFIQTFRSKPGIIMVAAALVGGPIAGAAYVIALSMAGPIVTPIAALCPAIGAILSRFLFKQPMGPRVILGILICVFASGMIGFTGLTGALGPGVVPGLLLAFIAALGWGIEGCIGGFGTSMIDPQIGITIRQVTSGSVNLIIILPLLTLFGGGDLATTYQCVGQAFADVPSVFFFVASGFFAYTSFSNWYRGNSMCGTALGMACNGTYSFFVPLCSWIIIGLIMGIEGFALPAIAWIAALVMVAGITVIAVNPLDFLKKKGE
ncbi:hypothetical protein [Collinsella tanakaei]|uniref:hypothetical protein n=1 Tax=Collinsella tanakaei TaxID=626935 RepID=UPI0039F5E961